MAGDCILLTIGSCASLLPFSPGNNAQTTEVVSVLSVIFPSYRELCRERNQLRKTGLAYLPHFHLFCGGRKHHYSVFLSLLPKELRYTMGARLGHQWASAHTHQPLKDLKIKMQVLSTCLSFLGIVDSHGPRGLISVISERGMIRANGSKWR